MSWSLAFLLLLLALFSIIGFDKFLTKKLEKNPDYLTLFVNI